MQKKLIALAVVAAFSAPAFADVTVYGQAHVSLDSNSGNRDVAGTGTKNGLNLTSNSSRLGFKGAEDLAGGLKGVFQLETEVNTQGNSTLFAAQRDTYIGVAGGFGTLIAGRLPLANQYANDANFFAAKVGDAANFTAGGFGGNSLALVAPTRTALLAVPSRVNRAIAYVSPSLGGVTVLAAYVPNTMQSLTGTQNDVNKATSYTLRASYDSNGIFAAGNLVSIGGIAGTAAVASAAGGKINIVSLAGGYDFGVAKIRGQMVNSSANNASTGIGDVKQTVVAVGGQFKLGEDDVISAQVAKAQDIKVAGASVADTGATMMAVGYDHNLSKNTTVYAAIAKVSNGAAASFSASGYAHGGVGADLPTYPTVAAPSTSTSPSVVSIGLIRNF